MAQRSYLRPKLLTLIERAGGTKSTTVSIGALFEQFEQELMEIAQHSVQMPDGVKWDDLYWEDLPILLQAIWEVCVVREGDKGLMGKLASALGRHLGALLAQNSLKTLMSSPESSAVGSPSSPAGGAPTPSDSVTL